MKLKLITISIFALLAACGGDTRSPGQLPTGQSATTPQGVKVYSTKQITSDHLIAIDKGLNQVNLIASQPPNSYVGLPQHSEYSVYLEPASPQCSTPAFLLRADGSEYDGTKWDKDPAPGKVLLCVAGQMVGQTSMRTHDNAAELALITRYEAEHIILNRVDPVRFNETAIHSESNYHPILGDGTLPKGNNMRAAHIGGTCILITE